MKKDTDRKIRRFMDLFKAEISRPTASSEISEHFWHVMVDETHAVRFSGDVVAGRIELTAHFEMGCGIYSISRIFLKFKEEGFNPEKAFDSLMSGKKKWNKWKKKGRSETNVLILKNGE